MNFNSVNVEKYAYISVSIYFLLLPKLFQQQSLFNNLSVNNVVIEKKEK